MSVASIHAAIMCGGGGTRLWPVSRQQRPKQLQPLLTERSMLTETAARLRGLELELASLMLITGAAFSEDAAQAARAAFNGAPDALTPVVVVEPNGRNTAPCAAAACFVALEKDENAIVALLPADHHIADEPGFRVALAKAAELALEGYIVTLGVPPNAPETGFGYVKAGEKLKAGFLVERFVEKPTKEIAQQYLTDGGYYWNAGVFVASAKVLLEEMQRHAPDIHRQTQRAIKQGARKGASLHLDFEAWSECPSDSIDYAVAEKTERAAILPLNVGWSDVGSWSAIWELLPKDAFGNVAFGDVMLEGAGNCLIRAEKRLVAAIGVQDIIIVETGDAVMVVNKASVQDLKKIVQRLQKSERPEATSFRSA